MARSAAATVIPVRRSEKDLAAQVFVNSSDEEEAGRPVAPIDAPIVRAANGRIAGTPSKSAPSLKQLSQNFEERVRAIRQPLGARPISTQKREDARGES